MKKDRLLWGDGTRTLRSGRILHKKRKKVYYVDQKENSVGRFLKITEASATKRDTIIVPEELVDVFVETIANVMGNGKEV